MRLLPNVGHEMDGHEGASAPAKRSTTPRTSCDNPSPVTAEMASTSRPRSRSIRRRTSAAPVSSALLTATTSGLAASSGRYSSSSRRMVR